MTGTRERHWVVAGGGTGGHVTLALALAERIAARGDSVLLLGSEHGLETRLVPEAPECGAPALRPGRHCGPPAPTS